MVVPVLSWRGPNLGAKIGMQQAIWARHCGPETTRSFLGNRLIRGLMYKSLLFLSGVSGTVYRVG